MQGNQTYVWIYALVYRATQRILHRFNLHHTRTIHPEGDTLLICDWCGLRYLMPARLAGSPGSLRGLNNVEVRK